MSVSEIILSELERITGVDEVRKNLDLPLFEDGILDSLGTVELVAAIGEQLGVNMALAQVDREEWATPRKIILYVEQKIKG